MAGPSEFPSNSRYVMGRWNPQHPYIRGITPTNRQTFGRVVTAVYAKWDDFRKVTFPTIRAASASIIVPGQRQYTPSHRFPNPSFIPRHFPVIPGRPRYSMPEPWWIFQRCGMPYRIFHCDQRIFFLHLVGSTSIGSKDSVGLNTIEIMFTFDD